MWQLHVQMFQAATYRKRSKPALNVTGTKLQQLYAILQITNISIIKVLKPIPTDHLYLWLFVYRSAV